MKEPSLEVLDRVRGTILEFLTREGVLNYDKSLQAITSTRKSSSRLPQPILKLFSEMCQVFVDTYLIVLMTLEQICGKHIIVK